MNEPADMDDAILLARAWARAEQFGEVSHLTVPGILDVPNTSASTSSGPVPMDLDAL